MSLDITTSDGVFAPSEEPAVIAALYQTLLRAIDAEHDERAQAALGATLHVVPAARQTLGGHANASVRIDVILPAIALSTFGRRARFIAEATDIVRAYAGGRVNADRVLVRIVHAVDGGWGIGGRALTNEEMDT